MDYAALKAMYSGQDVPDWELERHGLKGKPDAPKVEATNEAPAADPDAEPAAPVRKPRRRKTEG